MVVGLSTEGWDSRNQRNDSRFWGNYRLSDVVGLFLKYTNYNICCNQHTTVQIPRTLDQSMLSTLMSTNHLNRQYLTQSRSLDPTRWPHVPGEPYTVSVLILLDVLLVCCHFGAQIRGFFHVLRIMNNDYNDSSTLVFVLFIRTGRQAKDIRIGKVAHPPGYGCTSGLDYIFTYL